MTSFFEKTIIANRVALENASNSQTLFCNRMRHMFIENLNHNNDSLLGNFVGNRLGRSDAIRQSTTVFGLFIN